MSEERGFKQTIKCLMKGLGFRGAGNLFNAKPQSSPTNTPKPLKPKNAGALTPQDLKLEAYHTRNPISRSRGPIQKSDTPGIETL